MLDENKHSCIAETGRVKTDFNFSQILSFSAQCHDYFSLTLPPSRQETLKQSHET